jgi:hypothetical protein
MLPINTVHKQKTFYPSELLGFRTLSIVRYSKKLETFSETESISILR